MDPAIILSTHLPPAVSRLPEFLDMLAAAPQADPSSGPISRRWRQCSPSSNPPPPQDDHNACGLSAISEQLQESAGHVGEDIWVGSGPSLFAPVQRTDRSYVMGSSSKSKIWKFS